MLKHTDCNSDICDKGFIIVREQDKGRFQYKRTENEQGKPQYMIYPIHLEENLPCYMECACSDPADARINRFYLPTFDSDADGSNQVKHTFKTIRKWFADNCVSKEKIDGIWIYTV